MLITKPGQLKGNFTQNDGLGLFQDNAVYDVHDCIVDLTECGLDDQDEALSTTWGASATFRRCWIRGAGKLVLCGSGDEEKKGCEQYKEVYFQDCLLENFGRRGPEVQSKMSVVLQDCMIRNWGDPTRFSVRNFGAWAHDKGSLDILNCIFWQDQFVRPLGQMLRDIGNHIGQAVNDGGVLALLSPLSYLPGVCRGATASNGGKINCWHCYRNHWWIKLHEHTDPMNKEEADELIKKIEAMKENLKLLVGA